MKTINDDARLEALTLEAPTAARENIESGGPIQRRKGPGTKIIAVCAVLLVVGFLMLRTKSGSKPAAPTTTNTSSSYQIVQTATVRRGNLQQTFAVTGSLKSNLSVNLSAKVTGRVAQVLVDEGAQVRKGQLLVTFEDEELRSQVGAATAALEAARVQLRQRQVQLPATSADIESSIRDAQANLASAQAKYRQAQLKAPAQEQGARSDVETARLNVNSAQVKVAQARETAAQTGKEVEAAIKQNQAVVQSAEAALAEVRRGSRAQEIAQAQQEVNVLEAQLANAEQAVKRSQELVRVGASAQSELDAAVTQRDVYKAQLESARQALSLRQEGSTNEQIRQSEEAVRQARAALVEATARRSTVINAQRDVTNAVTSYNTAQAALRTAQANLANIPVTQQDTRIAYQAVRQAQAAVDKARANRADVPVAREDIEAARANVLQARETLKQAQITLGNARIYSPVDGVVNTKNTAPGQAATAGSTLLNIVATGSVYFEAQVDENSVRDIRVGLLVQVTASSVSDKPLLGAVADVINVADAESRQFRVRVAIPDPGRRLTPGAFARGQIVTRSVTGALLVPNDAIRQENGKPIVLAVGRTGDVATTEKRSVQTGLSANGTTAVSGGLQSGDRVVVGNPLLRARTQVRLSGAAT